MRKKAPLETWVPFIILLADSREALALLEIALSVLALRAEKRVLVLIMVVRRLLVLELELEYLAQG